LRNIDFDIRTPTTIVFNSSLPENNMAVLRINFPEKQLPSTVNALPEVNDSLVAEDRTNGNKYLLGTVVSKNPIKIRTPIQYDPPPAPAARLELNNDNFKIWVINEERPRPPVRGGTKKRKTTKGKTLKRRGGKKNQRKRRTTRRGGTNGEKKININSRKLPKKPAPLTLHNLKLLNEGRPLLGRRLRNLPETPGTAEQYKTPEGREAERIGSSKPIKDGIRKVINETYDIDIKLDKHKYGTEPLSSDEVEELKASKKKNENLFDDLQADLTLYLSDKMRARRRSRGDEELGM
jgi:hypothetical protein